ncbi:MAG: hypothetical protein BWY57_01341 [Betaproteobacteria bacterium ADurb.Bin341]|nr:MAG: hypothetical protein BWY57_01341 [Betaproteobacteria bacterium ADurb.Bin341]
MLKLHPRRTIVTALIALAVSASVAAGAPPDDQLGDEAPVYAVIDWPDRSPRYVNLGADQYLVATKAGMQVWDALRNRLRMAENWPAHSRFVEWQWARLATGTLLVAESHSDNDRPLPALVWWDAASGRFSAPLAAQPSVSVKALVRLDESHALACLSLNDPQSGDKTPARFRAAVVEVLNPAPRWGSASMQVLQSANIRGPVDGVGTVVEPSGAAKPAPVYFNTLTCQWEIRNPPAELHNVRSLNLMHQRLPDGRIVISHADWDRVSDDKTPTLAAPLLWSESEQRWVNMVNTAQNPNGPGPFRAYGIDDLVVSMPTSGAEFVEFLDPKTLRWIRSQQRLPETYGPSVGPLSTGEALVFLWDSGGRVLKVGPLQQVPAGHFVYPHGFLGEVRLHDGILLYGGGGYWYPQNRLEILRLAPTPASSLIAPLPKPLAYLSGVELADRSIVLFGGSPPRCFPSRLEGECVPARPQPVYRYLPKEDRWLEVSGLSIRFAIGPSLDSQTMDFACPRRDAVARRNSGFVFLDGEDERFRQKRDWSRMRTTAYEWRPGGQLKSLGQLQQGRAQVSLLELKDGRLAVMGGQAQVDIGKRCIGCAFDTDSVGPLEFATSTEVLSKGKWKPGPKANFPGGLAVKLANGRIFKLSLANLWTADQGYNAEMADARFRRWAKLPPLPLREFTALDVQVVGNRVLILPTIASHGKNNDKVVIWDDVKRKWLVWQKPTKLPILSIIPVGPEQVLIRHSRTYQQLALPK